MTSCHGYCLRMRTLAHLRPRVDLVWDWQLQKSSVTRELLPEVRQRRALT
jgi:hypothetical protein